MRSVLLVAWRELASYLSSMSGYLILSLILLIDGLLFNAFAMGGEKKSSLVVEMFFFYSSGMIAIASVFISMRTFAEEKQLGTLVLLETSPMHEWQVVLGKFLGAWSFLLLLLALSAYLPALVLVNGKATIGHVLSGYLGLALLGAVCIAVGIFASALSPNQIVAAVIAGVLISALFLCWLVSRAVEGPLGDVLGFMDVFDKHFRSFSRGTVKLGSVAYYLAMVYAALVATTSVVGARRWRG